MIDAYASAPHYLRHIAPVWKALGPLRGVLYAVGGAAGYAEAHQMAHVPRTPRRPAPGPLLVASYADASSCPKRDLIYIEHGAGQTYPASSALAESGSYSGGSGLDHVSLFLCPSHTVGDRWRVRYPLADVSVVGVPALDVHLSLDGRVERACRHHVDGADPGPRPTVALAFHWDGGSLCPEAGWAFPFFRRQIERLASDPSIRLLGHGHPRARPGLEPFYARAGIEAVPDIDEVLRRADLLVVDNSSVAVEMAAVGAPILFLNAPTYRTDVEHGGRFWTWVGDQVCASMNDDLRERISAALADPKKARVSRAAMVKDAYAFTDAGSSGRAVDAITSVLARSPVATRAPV